MSLYIIVPAFLATKGADTLSLVNAFLAGFIGMMHSFVAVNVLSSSGGVVAISAVFRPTMLQPMFPVG
jgi:hypothetical protein